MKIQSYSLVASLLIECGNFTSGMLVGPFLVLSFLVLAVALFCLFRSYQRECAK